jgi:hypothetical protein
MHARITGPVLAVSTRRDTSRTGKPYVMHEVTVFVAESGVAAFSVFGDPNTEALVTKDGQAIPSKGELVDVLVEVESRRGGFLNVSYVSAWPEQTIASASPKPRAVTASA